MGNTRRDGKKIVVFPKNLKKSTVDALCELWQSDSWTIGSLENMKDE